VRPLRKGKRKEREWEEGTWRERGIKHREAEYRKRQRKRGGQRHVGKAGKERSPKGKGDGVELESGGNMSPKMGGTCA